MIDPPALTRDESAAGAIPLVYVMVVGEFFLEKIPGQIAAPHSSLVVFAEIRADFLFAFAHTSTLEDWLSRCNLTLAARTGGFCQRAD